MDGTSFILKIFHRKTQGRLSLIPFLPIVIGSAENGPNLKSGRLPFSTSKAITGPPCASPQKCCLNLFFLPKQWMNYCREILQRNDQQHLRIVFFFWKSFKKLYQQHLSQLFGFFHSPPQFFSAIFRGEKVPKTSPWQLPP